MSYSQRDQIAPVGPTDFRPAALPKRIKLDHPANPTPSGGGAATYLIQQCIDNKPLDRLVVHTALDILSDPSEVQKSSRKENKTRIRVGKTTLEVHCASQSRHWVLNVDDPSSLTITRHTSLASTGPREPARPYRPNQIQVRDLQIPGEENSCDHADCGIYVFVNAMRAALGDDPLQSPIDREVWRHIMAVILRVALGEGPVVAMEELAPRLAHTDPRPLNDAITLFDRLDDQLRACESELLQRHISAQDHAAVDSHADNRAQRSGQSTSRPRKFRHEQDEQAGERDDHESALEEKVADVERQMARIQAQQHQVSAVVAELAALQTGVKSEKAKAGLIRDLETLARTLQQRCQEFGALARQLGAGRLSAEGREQATADLEEKEAEVYSAAELLAQRRRRG